MPQDTAILKPATAELVVRHPDNLLPLRADGERVPLTTYWHRRIAEGDVMVLPEPIDAPAARKVGPVIKHS